MPSSARKKKTPHELYRLGFAMIAYPTTLIFRVARTLEAALADLKTVFFFNDTATTEIYALSLLDALPICASSSPPVASLRYRAMKGTVAPPAKSASVRSEEHTSELQSRGHLVCRLLL